MSGDMVERVARAIEAGISRGHVAGTIARAALEAMREPTNVMLHASNLQWPTWDSEASRRKWQAMIDAALSEGRG